MPVIKVNDEQFALPAGPTRLGGGSTADVRVADDTMGIQAIITLGPDGRAVIRREGEVATVRVNGVPLGIEPTPLLHGDKVEVAGRELFYSDDTKSGATQYVSASDIAALAQKRSGPARATAATGGRLVSLVDGKEYAIPDSGLTIGRDASATVVVAQREVSRLHAEILPAENGYVIHDRSANGLFVNGARVQVSQLLSRADVIRAGTEDFRFYADVARASTVASAPSGSTPGGTPAPPLGASAPPPATPAQSLFPDLGDVVQSEPEGKLAATTAMPNTVPARPSAGPGSAGASPAAGPPPSAAPPAAAASAKPAGPAGGPPGDKPTAPRPVIALVEIIAEGPMKGTKFEIRTPLAHVGRGTHNDIVLPDESVSDTHAKIQRRDDGWYVVDADSTNGTYVGGARIVGERRLEGAPDLRFGGVKTIFRSMDRGPSEITGTRAIAARKVEKRPSEAATVPMPVATPTGKSKIPMWVWIVIALAVIGAAVVLGPLLFSKH